MAQKQRIGVEIKSLSEDGSFKGRLAVYNNVDMGNDLIEPGAFTKTIQEKGGKVVLLWQHKSDVPIGDLTLSDTPEALDVTGQLLLDVPEARTAYALLKAGVIKGLSIGYDTVKSAVQDGVRHLKELRLWEGSIVTFPMNEAAMITAVKMKDGKVIESKGDFNEELAENQLRSAGYMMFDALCTALCSVTWAAGLDKAQKTEAAQMIIGQFEAAYMTYYPQYLDWLTSEYGDMELMGRERMEQKAFAATLGRGIKTIELSREVKEGRVLSTATKKSMKEAHGHIKSADEIFTALLNDEAGDELDDDPDEQMGKTGDDATSETKAAVKEETEPVPDHSAAEEILAQVRSLIPKA